MSMESAIWIARIVVVVALLGGSAALATPRGRLPLALRGVRRIMRRDRGISEASAADGGEKVSAGRKFFAFLLAIIAIILAII